MKQEADERASRSLSYRCEFAEKWPWTPAWSRESCMASVLLGDVRASWQTLIVGGLQVVDSGQQLCLGQGFQDRVLLAAQDCQQLFLLQFLGCRCLRRLVLREADGD